MRAAAEILPLEEIPAAWFARPDLYSDWFRYELLKRGLGTWLDTDVYLVAPLNFEQPHLFGIEKKGLINNAVLRLPPESPLLPRLLEPFIKRTTPRWMTWRTYIPVRFNEFMTGSADLTKIPWGTTSPQALTSLARQFGIDHLAEPQQRFYPVHWKEADWILDPAKTLESMTTEETVAVHLWNKWISPFKNKPAPNGSFLHRLHEEGE